MSLFIVTMPAITLRLWFTQHLQYKIPKRPNLNSGFCLSVTLFLLVAPSELNRKMLLPPFYTLKTSAPSTLALLQMPLTPPSSSFEHFHFHLPVKTILLLLQNNPPNHPPPPSKQSTQPSSFFHSTVKTIQAHLTQNQPTQR